MVRAILFDLDGVLTLEKTGSQSIVRYLAQHTGLSPEKLKQAYGYFNRELLYGKITHPDMWQPFCSALGRELPYGLLKEAFENTPMDDQMLRLVSQLKKTFLIGMVTDNKADRVETILDHFHLRAFFDAVSISARLGSGKREEAIFRYTLDALHISADEAVFIDNSKENLIVPQQMGMHVIWFDDEKRDMDALREVLGKYIG